MIHMDLISWGFVVLALAGVGFITLAIVKDWS